MATAKEERERAARGEGPLGKAADDEPVFILRAQDKSAALFVKFWAWWNEDESPPEKVQEARRAARAMDAWPTKKVPD